MCVYLLVSLQLLGEGALVVECVQTLLRVVLAELLEGGGALTLGQARVLEARSIHDQERAQRMHTGLQSPVREISRSEISRSEISHRHAVPVLLM